MIEVYMDLGKALAFGRKYIPETTAVINPSRKNALLVICIVSEGGRPNNASQSKDILLR